MKWIFRRRHLVLDFQYYLLASNLMYLVLSFLIFVAILLAPVALEVANSQNPTGRTTNPLFWVHVTVWPAIVLVFALLLTHSILISHKIAGPLYRFRGFFKTLGEGNLAEQLSIRKRDYLQDDANLINEMRASLSVKMTGIKERYQTARATLNQLVRALDGGSTTEIGQKVKLLEQQMESLKAEIDHFRTS